MNLIPEIVLDFHRLFPSTAVQEDDMDAVDKILGPEKKEKKKKEVKKDKKKEKKAGFLNMFNSMIQVDTVFDSIWYQG